jgi:hypothetical protein
VYILERIQPVLQVNLGLNILNLELNVLNLEINILNLELNVLNPKLRVLNLGLTEYHNLSLESLESENILLNINR